MDSHEDGSRAPGPGLDAGRHTTIEAALALAVRAPSVHNSQPWRWLVGSDTVDLYADRDRELTKIDPEGRDLLLSCGAALQHLTVALAALGWATEVQRLPTAEDPYHLARVTVVENGAEQEQCAAERDIEMAAAIPRRRTDRRLFSAWPVPRSAISLMAGQAARYGVGLRQVDDPVQLTEIVTRAVREHLSDAEYLAELTRWSGRRGTAAGVPAESTPAPLHRAAFSARVFANPQLSQPAGAQAQDDAGVTLILATETDERIDHLRAGEATGAVLLTATAAGLAACPLTEPLEVTETRAELQDKLLGGEMFPQMLLRIGWAAVNADPLPATPRRPLNAVARHTDGSPLTPG
jgi:nitroreductase